jgi:Putative zinc-finger
MGRNKKRGGLVTHADKELESHLRASGETNGTPPSVTAAASSDHADILDQLSDYVDGSLSTDDAEHVRQHLDGCEPCQAFWRTLRKTVTATRQLPAEGLPESTRRRLINDALSVPT